jgi:asparagine synthase (glutamine-hydrolysing)
MLYRPFHTTLESGLEQQPHRSLSGQITTWTGRLDNREELLSALDHSSKDDFTDVGIVAAAFERWGKDCFAKFIGDWAMTIWDPINHELIFARDYIGIRTLFYHATHNGVTWCSHLAPLALSGVQFSLCEEYIASYFAGSPGSHLTPYNEIASVGAGNFVRIRPGHVERHNYWTFSVQPGLQTKTDKEYEEIFLHLFRQSVKRRLRTDSPILAELSGGLDSSSIVCMSDDIVQKAGASYPPVDTFSACDRDEPTEDDHLYFVRVEEKRGRAGHHVEFNSTGETYRLWRPTFIAIPGFALREEFATARSRVIAKGKYRVLLSGEGGDQVCGQSRIPRIQVADLLAQAKFSEAIQMISAWTLYARRPWIRFCYQSLAVVMPTFIQKVLYPLRKGQPWINRKFAQQYQMIGDLLPTNGGALSPGLRESLRIVQQLPGVVASFTPESVEKRYPYLDQNLVEFLTSIPLNQLIRPGERRPLMRRALTGIVPGEILARRTKASSGRCDILFLHKHWHALEPILASPISTRLGYVDSDHWQTAVSDMKKGLIPDMVVGLLKVLSLELWLRDAVMRGVLRLPQSPLLGETPLPYNHLRQAAS